MTTTQQSLPSANRLMRLSMKYPVLLPVTLFIAALALRTIDIFVLRLDEDLGEIILSKSLGLVLVVGYVWAAGRRLRSIGFHHKELVRSLKIAGIGVGRVVPVRLPHPVAAAGSGWEPGGDRLLGRRSQDRDGGGMLFALWLVLGNLINAAME